MKRAYRPSSQLLEIMKLDNIATRLSHSFMATLFLASLLFLTGLLTLPQPLAGQERLKDFDAGDGRIHGAPTLQVTEKDLHSGQVQTINLHPRFHTVLEFPYPVARVDAGDPEVFLADIVGNKLTLKATKVTQEETSMTVILGDADMTVVPFLIRTDTEQPPVYVVKYTDPLSKHLNQTEQRIAKRLQSDFDQRVEKLADERVKQRLLYSGEIIPLERKKVKGKEAGRRFGLELQHAQQMPGPSGSPRLYIRYRVINQTIAPLEDLSFVVRMESKESKFVVGETTNQREVFDVQNIQSASKVPAGMAAEGLLIMDALDLEDGESISIEAVGFNGQRSVKINHVLTGN